MKAIIAPKYGGPEVLKLRDIETPSPKPNEVLVNVRAASLNAADFEILRGAWSARFLSPLRPKHKIPGSDVTGQVEAVGEDVTEFQSGDNVVGDLFMYGHGAFAEYVCAPETAFTRKSAHMSFEEAATYPQAAIIALQALRGKKQIESGHKVLINGGGGGMGTFGIQIAKYYGADVTGVDSARKLDMMRSIGADHVIDYQQEDFTKRGEYYDIIVDTVARRSLSSYKRVLNPGGLFVMVGGSRSAIFQAAFLGPLYSRDGDKHLGLNLWSEPYNKEDMDFLEELFEAGDVVPVIDRCYSLMKVPDALRYLEEGLALGKVVISIESDSLSL
ncbi:MAG: NAD(P)-dependent alcohol dehydrogenase [Candidatus Bathyarchaeota archaeon]|nr:NAD(P)-dependent alcohol dehydrogenase [Candidatus Bathyarchaeota archaeon]